MEKLITKAATLIEALPYFQEFRNSIVVIKFGGSAMEKHDLIKKTMRDIVFMECIGMKPVVVHGGGKAITARSAELNIETKFVNGLRQAPGVHYTESSAPLATPQLGGVPGVSKGVNFTFTLNPGDKVILIHRASV